MRNWEMEVQSTWNLDKDSFNNNNNVLEGMPLQRCVHQILDSKVGAFRRPNKQSLLANVLLHVVEGSLFHLYMCRNVVFACNTSGSWRTWALHVAYFEVKINNFCQNREPSTVFHKWSINTGKYLGKKPCRGLYILTDIITPSRLLMGPTAMSLTSRTLEKCNSIILNTTTPTGLDHIFIRLGPAPPTPPSLPGLLAHTCVGTLPSWEPMWQYPVT
jgi:hypothetical protein